MIRLGARADEELSLLRGWFGDQLEYRPAGQWVRIRDYRIPEDLWLPAQVDIAFQIPEQIPGQAPYGFHVLPGVALISGGSAENYTYPTSNTWGDGWGTFSWALDDWRPAARASDGSNMLEFARSIANRFRQGA